MSSWQLLQIVTAIPAKNTNGAIVSPVLIDSCSSIEIRGHATAGTKSLILMRRAQIDPSNFQWQPFAVDKASSPMENPDALGWFWDRFALPEECVNEYFAALNPGGNLSFDADPVLACQIRGMRY